MASLQKLKPLYYAVAFNNSLKYVSIFYKKSLPPQTNQSAIRNESYIYVLYTFCECIATASILYFLLNDTYLVLYKSVLLIFLLTVFFQGDNFPKGTSLKTAITKQQVTGYCIKI